MRHLVILRLIAAGKSLVALQGSDGPRKLKTQSMAFLQIFNFDEKSDPNDKIRILIPSALAIDQMDETLRWLQLIPNEKYVIRRIISLRMLTDPRTDRPLYTWKKIALLINANHRATAYWFNCGIDIILAELIKINIRQGKNNTFIIPPL